MSGYIAGSAASKTMGTFVLANNTTEQTILDIPNADRVVQDVNVRLNVTALTKNNAISASTRHSMASRTPSTTA